MNSNSLNRVLLALIALAAIAIAPAPRATAGSPGHLALAAHPTVTFVKPSVAATRGAHLKAYVEDHWTLKCYDRQHRLVWTRHFDNMLTTAGANKYLDATIKTGLASPAWYVGLIYNDLGTAPTFATGDTMGSHTGWTEVTGTQVTNASQPAFTPGTIASGSVDNSGSVAVYTGNATTDLTGAFLADNNTLAGTTGTLLGEGAFTAAPIASGYTINVTVTVSITAG